MITLTTTPISLLDISIDPCSTPSTSLSGSILDPLYTVAVAAGR